MRGYPILELPRSTDPSVPPDPADKDLVDRGQTEAQRTKI